MLGKLRANFMPILIVLILGGGVAAMISRNIGGSDNTSTTVRVNVPNLSATAREGEALYNNSCAACHGDNASGSAKGPPLIHSIYNPGHHPDGAFYFAAEKGVRAHHWGFGNMPPVAGIKKSELEKIIRYIRDLQLANNIITKPHVM